MIHEQGMDHSMRVMQWHDMLTIASYRFQKKKPLIQFFSGKNPVILLKRTTHNFMSAIHHFI
jgi:hypothetical protein